MTQETVFLLCAVSKCSDCVREEVRQLVRSMQKKKEKKKCP